MLKYAVLAIATFLGTQAQAATREEVAAVGCFTLAQARQFTPTADRFKYRRIGGRECWYSDELLVAKAPPPVHKARAARIKVAGPMPAMKRIIKDAEVDLPLDEPVAVIPVETKELPPPTAPVVPLDKIDEDNNLQADKDFFEFLCGGPCPQLKNEK